MGLNDAALCGALANIEKESTFRPTASYVESNGATSYGICQWNSVRLENLKSFCKEKGYNYTTLEGQLWFLKYELEEGTEKNVYGTIKNVPNNKDGAYLSAYHWAKYFERCISTQHVIRAEFAVSKYWPVYGNGAQSEYEEIATGTYLLKNAKSGKYLTVKDGKDANNTNIIESEYTGSNAQQFALTPGLLGYSLRTQASQTRVLNIYATYVASGKNVCLWDHTGDTSQLWFFDAVTGGYIVRSVQNYTCVLDTESNANVRVVTSTGASSQIWVLQTPEEAYREHNPVCPHPTQRTEGYVAPTCSLKGYTGDVYCTICNERLSTGTLIPALPHTNTRVENYVAPSCTLPGYSGNTYCNDCGALVSSGDRLEKLPHGETRVEDYIAPSCATPGFSGNTYCNVCNTIVSFGAAIPKLPHGDTLTEGYKAPTCSEEGYTGNTRCSVCNEMLSGGSTIEKLPHDYESSYILPTPSSSGYTKYRCKVCSHSYGDNFVDYDENSYPTLTVQNGYATRNESISIVISGENFPAVGTIEFSSFDFDPALTLSDFEWIGSVGSAKKTDNKLSVTFDTPVILQGALVRLTFTVSSTAEDSVTEISLDSRFTYESVDGAVPLSSNVKKGKFQIGPCDHKSLEYTEALAQSCTAEGNIAYYTCPVCQSLFADGEALQSVSPEDVTLPSLGHSFNSHFTVDVEPTQTTGGVRSKHCIRCEEKMSVTPMVSYQEAKKGDLDGDETISMLDLLFLRKYLLGGDPDSSWLYIDTFDTDSDGAVSMTDLLNIRKYTLGLITEF